MNKKTTIPETALETIACVLKQYRPDLSPEAISTALNNAGNQPTEQLELTRPPMTRKAAATMLSLSLSTIDNYIKDGTLRAVKLGNAKRLVRVDADSIDALLGKTNTTTANA